MADHHGRTDRDHHEPFDAEPVRELSEGEPTTPLWLPALGLGLFLVVGIWWATGTDETDADKADPSVASSAAASGAVAPAPNAPAPPPGLKVLRPVGSQRPGNPVRRAPGRVLPRGGAK